MYYSFFALQVIWNALMKHQYPNRFALVLQTSYFHPKYLLINLVFQRKFDSNRFYFVIFRRSALNLRKNKSMGQGNVFYHLVPVTRSTYPWIIFGTIYISKIHTKTLKGIRKVLFPSDLPTLINFKIWKFLNFTGVSTKKKLPKLAYSFSSEKSNFSLIHRDVARIWNKFIKISWKFLSLMASHRHSR